MKKMKATNKQIITFTIEFFIEILVVMFLGSMAGIGMLVFVTSESPLIFIILLSYAFAVEVGIVFNLFMQVVKEKNKIKNE